MAWNLALKPLCNVLFWNDYFLSPLHSFDKVAFFKEKKHHYWLFGYSFWMHPSQPPSLYHSHVSLWHELQFWPFRLFGWTPDVPKAEDATAVLTTFYGSSRALQEQLLDVDNPVSLHPLFMTPLQLLSQTKNSCTVWFLSSSLAMLACPPPSFAHSFSHSRDRVSVPLGSFHHVTNKHSTKGLLEPATNRSLIWPGVWRLPQ